MIVGTAGHIDHGKTSLVRALTGVDTDRLAEEKARGISIELGYAYLDVPGSDARLGFIDVPGHERLVHTMLAGASGIDFALLLVAADDGVMTQTREHLAVLSLLGIDRGAVVVTKTDRVDASRVAAVRDDVAALVAGTSLATAPVLALSSQSGEGLDALRQHLFDAARTLAIDHPPAAGFRLAVDRAFTLNGVGTVVTGTVHAGRVRVGDTLALTPSANGETVRVRSVHAQNRAVDAAEAGQRCALGLAGIGRDEVARGQWLVSPAIATSTDRLDAVVALWHDEAKPLRSGTRVHAHVGTVDVLATVAVLRVLDADASTAADAAATGAAVDSPLPPGGRAWVQVVLQQPIAAWHGDRIVLRDASASRTIAGGTVLDPFAPARYRRTAPRFAELAARSLGRGPERLAALVDAAPQGLSLGLWLRAEGLVDMPADALPPDVLLAGDGSTGSDVDDWVLGRAQHQRLHDATLTALRAFHAAEPELLGPDAARLRRLAAPRLPMPIWAAALAAMQQAGLVESRGAWHHSPEHGLRLSAADQRLAQKIAPLIDANGFEGQWARDLARDARESEALMRTMLGRLAQCGDLHQVVKDLYFSPATMATLAAHARRVAATHDGAITAAGFRDATGLGRKRAIQLLEYFDRIGWLRRVGDRHLLRTDSTLFTD